VPSKIDERKHKQYSIIYADPPWFYPDINPKCKFGLGAIGHYSVMKTEDICNLAIPKTADNAFLFLWVTNPNLLDGLKVMESWGFKYVTTGFTWVKLNKKAPTYKFGTGYYTRSNVELCLLGKRGKPKVMSHSVSSLIVEPLREHSRKPDCTRDRIVELCGDVKRVELFARTKTPGWDVWGNDVNKFKN
jgi:N6-adenosine-specific RNA methylase IME4